MNNKYRKMISLLLCVCFVVSCIGCGKTQGDIVGAGENEAPGSYITITDEMLQNSVVFCGNEDDWNHTPEVFDAMVDVFEGGSSNISEFLQYTCNGIDPDTIIYVGVISRPTKKPSEYILHPDPEKEKDTSYKEKLYPEVTFDEYSEKFHKINAVLNLYDFIKIYISSLKNQGYSLSDIVSSEFFIKAFNVCTNSEYGLPFFQKYKAQGGKKYINTGMAKAFEKNGFKVVWDGHNAAYAAYSSNGPVVESNKIGCVVATTVNQLIDFSEKIPEDESYQFVIVPKDAEYGLKVQFFKKLMHTFKITPILNNCSIDDFFKNVIASSSTPEKYTDGNIFCLTADSPGMDQAKYEELMKIKQQFISAGLIK